MVDTYFFFWGGGGIGDLLRDPVIKSNCNVQDPLHSDLTADKCPGVSKFS